MSELIELLKSAEFWTGLAVVVSLVIGNSTHSMAGGEKFKTAKRVQNSIKDILK